jgi:hypothetical protein
MNLFENRIKATIKEEFLINPETLAELGK